MYLLTNALLRKQINFMSVLSGQKNLLHKGKNLELVNIFTWTYLCKAYKSKVYIKGSPHILLMH